MAFIHASNMNKQDLYQVTISDVEKRILIKGLTVLKEKQIKEDKDYSFLDDLIVKFCDAPLKGSKKHSHESR